jgi:hypothetical protein
MASWGLVVCGGLKRNWAFFFCCSFRFLHLFVTLGCYPCACVQVKGSGGSGSESNSSSNKASLLDDDQVIGAFTIAASYACFAWCVLCMYVCPNLAPPQCRIHLFLLQMQQFS